MVDAWVAVIGALATGAAGYLGHVFQSRIPTKDNVASLVYARRAEALAHFRWAAELAVSEDEARRHLGAGQLGELVRSSHLNGEDLARVRAAIESAVVPRLDRWQTGGDPDDVEEVEP